MKNKKLEEKRIRVANCYMNSIDKSKYNSLLKEMYLQSKNIKVTFLNKLKVTQAQLDEFVWESLKLNAS